MAKKREISVAFIRLRMASQDLIALRRVAKLSRISLSELVQIILVKEIDKNNWLDFTKN